MTLSVKELKAILKDIPDDYTIELSYDSWCAGVDFEEHGVIWKSDIEKTITLSTVDDGEAEYILSMDGSADTYTPIHYHSKRN
jgi:hypothetical protein